jgi:hypothetical protein
MQASDFKVGQQFRTHGPGHNSNEIKTVTKVCSDFIIWSSNLQRWADVDCVTTDVSLAIQTIELLDPLTHYTGMIEESRRAA